MARRKKATDAETETPVLGSPVTGGRGWGAPRAGDEGSEPEVHYFRAGASLCGTFVLFHGDLSDVAGDSAECAECRKRLEALEGAS